MVYQWELEEIQNWTTNEIKNCIWAAADWQPGSQKERR